MKRNIRTLVVGITLLILASYQQILLYGASVGPDGYFSTFDVLPAPQDWATYSYPGAG
ncbi:MAG: hypothetical protein ACPMAG_13030 [Limisphaerales bacterium]|jgi:hypothetical protein